jgi:hypothetical protein
MIELLPTLDLLIGELERMSVKYAVMGGLAVRAYAIPRVTADIDLTVGISRERLPDLFDSLEAQGYAIPEPYRTEWVDQVRGLTLVKLKRYVGKHSIDVDLFLAESNFQVELLNRRRVADVDGRKLWIASPEDLVLLKLAAGRPRDLIDVADVFFTQGDLDVQYMRKWAVNLDIQKELERALAEQIERP